MHSVLDLDPVYRAQAQLAYEEYLRLIFLLAVVEFVLALTLIVSVRSGRIDRKTSEQQSTVRGPQPPSRDEVSQHSMLDWALHSLSIGS